MRAQRQATSSTHHAW